MPSEWRSDTELLLALSEATGRLKQPRKPEKTRRNPSSFQSSFPVFLPLLPFLRHGGRRKCTAREGEEGEEHGERGLEGTPGENWEYLPLDRTMRQVVNADVCIKLCTSRVEKGLTSWTSQHYLRFEKRAGAVVRLPAPPRLPRRFSDLTGR